MGTIFLSGGSLPPLKKIVPISVWSRLVREFYWGCGGGGGGAYILRGINLSNALNLIFALAQFGQ